MQDERERLDQALRNLAIHGGASDLIDRWARRAGAFRSTTLEWKQVPSVPGAPTSWKATHGCNHFQIDGEEDAGRLSYVWLGRGGRPLGKVQPVAKLMEVARVVAQHGGPFGGPAPTSASEAAGELAAGSRRSHRRGETRLEQLGVGLFLLLNIRPSGVFSYRLVSGPEQATVEAARLEDSDVATLTLHKLRVPWQFADCLPLFGYFHGEPYEFLLCALGLDQLAIVAFADGDWVATRLLAPAQLVDFRASDMLVGGDAPAVSLPGDAVGSRPAHEPRTNVSTMDPAAATAPSSRPEPASSPQERSTPEVAGPPAGAPATPDLAVSTPAPEAECSTPSATLGPPATPPTKRRGRTTRRPPGRPLEQLVARHFAHVAAQIPGNQVGAGTARLIWIAIQQAHHNDLGAITGRGVEVLRDLHAAGVLARMPADHAGRAALQILGRLSPILRRVHHRRWSLMLPELRQENSDVVRAIRELEPS